MLKSGAKTGITDAGLPDSGHPIVIPHPGLRRIVISQKLVPQHAATNTENFVRTRSETVLKHQAKR